MARHSSDREDLMAEAVTLSPRVALTVPGVADELIAGQRVDGRWSIFFNGDPVYHFDPEDRLRRAFLGGNLYRSQGTTLARLTRQESPTETVLLRHDLNAQELSQFWQDMCNLLARLATALQDGAITVQQTIPEDADFLPELARRLRNVLPAECRLAPALKK
jgi:hypothetical protein